MLLTKEVEINLHYKNIEHYKLYGYQFPIIINKKNKLVVPKDTKLMVKVEHLHKYSKAELEILCDYCSNIFKRQHVNYMKSKKKTNKDACENCKSQKVAESRIMPIEEIINDFELHEFEVIEGIETYVNKRSYFKLKCKNNHIWITSYFNFKRVLECPECSGHKIWLYSDVILEFKKNDCELLTKESEYTGVFGDVTYKCKCGNIHTKAFYLFRKAPNCPRCNPYKKLYTTEIVRDILAENDYTLLSEYQNSHSPLEYLCNKGHYSNSTSLLNYLKGARCMQCYQENNRGKNHPGWNHNKTDEERLDDRKFLEYKYWRKSVFERDNYTCQSCGDNKGGNLIAHHKDAYSWCKERRLDVNNGVTLCENCHALNEDSFHRMYGFINNTEEQFNEWLTIINVCSLTL
jgi:5-methylcytosine-specific restriction endonuclease McrA